MLLNEFLKEHEKVQELQSPMTQQEKQIELFGGGFAEGQRPN